MCHLQAVAGAKSPLYASGGLGGEVWTYDASFAILSRNSSEGGSAMSILSKGFVSRYTCDRDGESILYQEHADS